LRPAEAVPTAPPCGETDPWNELRPGPLFCHPGQLLFADIFRSSVPQLFTPPSLAAAGLLNLFHYILF
jgi:hypothetical protein